jgi:diacylglycerol kinase (ATP)
MKQKIRFIINPISGVGSKADLPHLIETHLDKDKFDYDIAITEYRKHAKTLAYQSAREGFNIVCAVGGDGSVHEVGTALIGTQTKLAILPTGSGNGLARHLNIPLNIAKAIKCINTLNVITMDTVLVNDKPFLGVGGYGFDAIVAKKFDEYHTRGFWGYLKLAVKEYYKFKPITVSYELNGITVQEPVILFTIANASEYGNGFCISPQSDVTDGKLELYILRPFSILAIPSVVFRLFNKSGHNSRFSKIIQFEKARILLNEKIAHYDGEPFEVRGEINVQVVPKSLHILVGKNK